MNPSDFLELFQSTPSRRGRPNDNVPSKSTACFNPLPHAEGDDPVRQDPENVVNVSIHSLTQRETWIIRIPNRSRKRVSIHSLTQRETPGFFYFSVLKLFQSTPSRRGRLLIAVIITELLMFQSTPSRRGRQSNCLPLAEKKCFNPLPHAEGDN